MSIRDDLAQTIFEAMYWVDPTDDIEQAGQDAEHLADAVLDWLKSADKPWVCGSEPHMDGSHTVCVAKYHDGRPGTVTVRVPAGYVLAKVWP